METSDRNRPGINVRDLLLFPEDNEDSLLKSFDRVTKFFDRNDEIPEVSEGKTSKTAPYCLIIFHSYQAIALAIRKKTRIRGVGTSTLVLPSEFYTNKDVFAKLEGLRAFYILL